ncbi:MAG TPA: bacillithiol biosynthesis deacetylase BshB1 [Candidatus Eisenbacteria bacterium]
MGDASGLDLLAIGSHPDDVEISCGGTLCLAAAQGYRVGILDLTRGELGTNGDPQTRAQEAGEAARILGVALRRNAGLPDGGIQACDRAQEQTVVALLRELRPAVLFAHYPRDRHPDHVEASRLVDRALYHAGLLRYDAPGDPFRPQARWHFASRVGFHPSVVVDISETWERKRESILAHASQVSPAGGDRRPTSLNEPEFLTRIEARARHFGLMIGVRYGEPFASADPVGFRDLRAFLGAPRPHPGAFTG